ncbi:unnamed protein product [Linum trigynum]|uniref:Secreted protein n=1 Tax=Linum trigynum TaxID=586398 RepID=A0AAV2EM28_9ROSI
MQVWAWLPWFDVKSSLTVSMTCEAAESRTLMVCALLFSRSYVNSASRNSFSGSAVEVTSVPLNQPETRQSFGALDRSYATLCKRKTTNRSN